MKNNPKIINAWCSYDWANSVYSLVITSAIFPVYYTNVMQDTSGEVIKVLGMKPEAAINLSLAISFFIVIFLSPILSSIADTIGNKLNFLKTFCYMGAISCILLYFFYDASDVLWALFFNITASVGFWGSLVFYNSYLPDIASEDKMDAISARGYITGYIGSVVLLGLCLVLILTHPENAGFWTRLSFLITGIWWIAFAQYAFAILPKGSKLHPVLPKNIIGKSFNELKLVVSQLFGIPRLKIFLGSFFFYSFGMQTIFLMAAVFGSVEIKLASDKLILTILLIQIEAIFGAWLFSWTSSKIGNKNTILIGIFLWIVACVIGYNLNSENQPTVQYQFYGLAGLVGLVMGGIQALSRSTYGKLLPPTEDTTTFFSFYDIFEKTALFFGLITFFLFTEYGDGMKQAVLAMGASFIISFLIMLKLPNQTK